MAAANAHMLCVMLASSLLCAAAAQGSSAADLAYVKKQAVVLRQNVMGFWMKYCQDKKWGGCYATLDTKGVAISAWEKGIFQTSRHLWAMSTYWQRVQRSTDAKSIADSTAQFIMSMFWNAPKKFLGYQVSESGNILLKPDFQTQANWFGLLGLATYGSTFGNRAASDMALTIYRTSKTLAWDKANGGWIQTADMPKSLNNAPDGAVKSINIQTHGAEALAALYQATKDAAVGTDLKQMVAIVANNIIVGSGPQIRVANFFKANWQPVEPAGFVADFPSSMQVWMMLDIIAQFPALFPDAAKNKAMVARILAAVLNAVTKSFDPATGSFCTSGDPVKGCVNAKFVYRDLPVQCEGINSLVRLYQYTSNAAAKAKYLQMLAKAVKWVSTKQLDSVYGEFKQQVDAAGVSVGKDANRKGYDFKSSYHTGRLVMYLAAAFP